MALNNSQILAFIALGLLAMFPMAGFNDYFLHIAISILLWGFIYTGWSLMGRFGLTSLGHGALVGIGAYVTTMLWNHMNITPWIGLPISVILSVVVAVAIGYPCFRLKITGHYFALVTLALGEVALLLIVALRHYTGGSLGVTPNGAIPEGSTYSLYAMQFTDKVTWFYIALMVWLLGLYVWRQIDRSMMRYALEAANEEEDAAASIGIPVTKTKLIVTAISAVIAAVGGCLYGQYQLYVNPHTVSGIAVSLNIVFAVIAGGMRVPLGPTIGAAFTLLLAEILRQSFGHEIHGLDVIIYGLMLVFFIIYMPQGLGGGLNDLLKKRGWI